MRKKSSVGDSDVVVKTNEELQNEVAELKNLLQELLASKKAETVVPEKKKRTPRERVEKQKEEENPDVERIRRETGDIVLKDGSRINRWGQEDFTPPGWERRTWPKEEDRPDHKQHREGKPSRTIGEETENESKQAPTNKELQTDLSKILEKIAFFEEKSKNSNMNLNTGTITKK